MNQARQLVGADAPKNDLKIKSYILYSFGKVRVLQFAHLSIFGFHIQTLWAGVGRRLLLWLPFIYEHEDAK